MPVHTHGRRRTTHPAGPALALSRPEAASRLGISVRMLELLGCDGPPIVRIGRRVLYPVSQLERYLERLTATAPRNTGRIRP